MRNLVINIQTALRAALTYVRDVDVWISPHEAFIPAGAQFPAVGIKDGTVKRRRLTAGMIEETLTVKVSVFQQLRQSPEAGMIGNDAAGQKGVLNIAEDIREALEDNLLDMAGMLSAECPSESASEFLLDDTAGLQMKVLTFEYVREREG